MNFEITLFRAADHTLVAEVPVLPGVIASAIDARTTLRRVLALALSVVAERIEFGELAVDPGESQFAFSINAAGRMLLAEDDVLSTIQGTMSADVVERVAAEIFDPVNNAMGGVRGGIDQALGRPRPQSRRGAIVLERLEAAGWTEQRSATTHRTLRRGQGEELVFPFRDDDMLQGELLHRIATLGGIRF